MSHDIVIAGAGPNGLMLACELALAGVRPVILERLTGPSPEQRANGLVGQVVRMLDRRGLYERLGGSAPPQPIPQYMFGAFPLRLMDLPENPVYILMVPQRRLEQVLAERATELAVEIRRGHEVTGLTQDAGGVAVDVAGPAGPYRLEAKFLVGADGGHSVTRKAAGIDFPGITTDNTVSRTAHVSVPSHLIDPSSGGLSVPGYGIVPPFMHHRTERGVIAFAPFPTGVPLLTTLEQTPHAEANEEPMTLDELRDSVRRVLGVDLPFGPPQGQGPQLLRRLTGGNTRLADRYRQGRVLLVGDAAHVHSAIGGPGLNLGLQDAINLGWKLAAELRGWAPPGLLDTYETERRPVGQRVTMHTQAQSVLVGPGSQITALRELFGELLADRHTVQHIADLISGADIRYPMMENGNVGNLIGRWAPDLLLHTDSGPARLAELTRDARPLLLDFTDERELAAIGAAWHDRVNVVCAHCDRADVTALLLRPDCYVAWASGMRSPDEREEAALVGALTQWFGSPAAVAIG
jgi:2-polyprenyl-6-methoxyphenol hydroxylase-like FAD-dependent oxidoreductase